MNLGAKTKRLYQFGQISSINTIRKYERGQRNEEVDDYGSSRYYNSKYGGMWGTRVIKHEQQTTNSEYDSEERHLSYS